MDAAIAAREGTKGELEKLRQAVKANSVSQSEVDIMTARFQAAEAEAERARISYESEINGEKTDVAQVRAQLDKARWDLDETVIYAPADGVITQVGLAKGSVVGLTAASHQMAFVHNDVSAILGTFPQNALRFVKIGDVAEVILDTLPGKTYAAEVKAIIPASGTGQLAPSGDLVTFAEIPPRDRIGVVFELVDKVPPDRLGAGVGGSVAIYTAKAKPVQIVRKVVVRMNTWLKYIVSG